MAREPAQVYGSNRIEAAAAVYFRGRRRVHAELPRKYTAVRLPLLLAVFAVLLESTGPAVVGAGEVRLGRARTFVRARHVLLASVLYLPMLLIVMAIDRRGI